MNTEDIKILVQAYYEGNTSPEQEDILFDYFAGDNVAEELQPEKEYFVQTARLEEAGIPPGFSGKIGSLFDELERKETKRVKLKRSVVWIGSIAAAAAIILLVANVHNTGYQAPITLAQADLPASEPSPIDTMYTSPVANKIATVKAPVRNSRKAKPRKAPVKTLTEEDYIKMKKALETVSISLNEGVEQLNTVSESFAQTSEIINNK